MKRLLGLLLTMMLLVSLCSCSGDTEIRGEISTTPSNEPDFSLGKTENNRYRNDYLGISCTLPSDWVFYTDEQILEINNIALDSFEGNIAEAIKNAPILYDMYATNPNDLSSTNINIEKLSAIQLLTLDLKANLESQFPALKTSFANMGYTNVQIVYQKVTVDGKEYDGMRATAQIQGIDFYTVSFCVKKGSYLVSINVTSFQTDKTATLLSYFSVS